MAIQPERLSEVILQPTYCSGLRFVILVGDHLPPPLPNISSVQSEDGAGLCVTVAVYMSPFSVCICRSVVSNSS